MAYQLERLENEARGPLLRLNEGDGGGGHWLRRLVARHWARAALRRLLARRPVESAVGLPPHLLRDIGLPSDFQPRGGVAQPLPPV